MANICSNEFLISCEDPEICDLIEAKLEKFFTDKLDGEVTYNDDGIIEGYFDSRWSFPDDLFDDFFDEFDDDTIYMRCLSVEYGCCYIALNQYQHGEWSTQSFDF